VDVAHEQPVRVPTSRQMSMRRAAEFVHLPEDDQLAFS
jgi:hypothetical protein